MIDVHIIQHPTQDRSATLEPLLEQLEREPVVVHLQKGYPKLIGRGRAEGFRMGDNVLKSYVDDDDEIVPGIFDTILKYFEKEPDIDGACTCETRESLDRMRWPKFRFKYYDKRHVHRTHHITTYKREAIALHLDFIKDLPTTSEHSLMAKVLLNNGRIRHIPKCGYIWRDHAGSTVGLGMRNHSKSIKLYNELRAAADADMADPNNTNLCGSHNKGQRFLTQEDYNHDS